MVNRTMPVYSNSRLKLFEQCPRAYRYKYIDKVDVEEVRNAYAFLGSRVHETLELLHEDLKNGKRNSLEDLLNYYNFRWQREWDSDIRLPGEDYSQEHFKKVGKECIENYYDNHEPFDLTRTVDTELRLYPEVKAKDREYTFLGFIDRLALTSDDRYEIHDYKTSKNLPSRQDLEDDRQLALYQLGVQQEYPEAEEVELVWHYVRFGKDVRITHSEDEIADIKEELLDLIGEIERSKNENEFPTARGDGARCDWCDFKRLCPEWSHLYETEDLPQNEFLSEEGVELVDKLASVEGKLERLEEERSELKEEKEKLKEAILKYADEEGLENVYGTEKRASIERDEKIRFPRSNESDRSELESTIKEAGLWDEVSYLSIRSLAKIFREDGWPDSVIDELENFKRTEKKTEVKLEDLEEN